MKKTFKAIESLESRISEVLTKRETEIKAVENELKKAEAQKETAIIELREATKKTDIESYKAAKANLADADALREMYNKRLSDLRGYDLITKQEYENVVASVREEIDQLDAAVKAKLVMLSKEMYQATAELREAVDKANPLLAKWQNTIYRNRDKQGSWQRGISIDKWATISWGNVGVQTNQYGQCTGEIYDTNKGKFTSLTKTPDTTVTKIGPDGRQHLFRVIKNLNRPDTYEDLGPVDNGEDSEE